MSSSSTTSVTTKKGIIIFLDRIEPVCSTSGVLKEDKLTLEDPLSGETTKTLVIRRRNYPNHAGNA